MNDEILAEIEEYFNNPAWTILAEKYGKELIKTLRYERAKSEWISVDDRLPDCNKEELVLVSCISGNGNHQHVLSSKYFDGQQVTHWMPLPKPPKNI